MKLAIVFDPDPALGTDPLDHANKPLSQGVWIDAAKIDVLLIYREYDDAFEGGRRTHVIGSGIWQNVTLEQAKAAIDQLSELPDG